MRKSRFAMLMVCSAASLVSAVASANEWSDGTIVISDGYHPFGDRCNSGRVFKESWCNGAYCDNMIFQCGGLPNVNGSQLSTTGDVQETGYTAGQDGRTSTLAVCPAGYAMVGMQSYASYSGNVKSLCQKVTGKPSYLTFVVHNQTSGDWTPYWISDGEGGVTDNTYIFDSNTRYHVFMTPNHFWWMSGASCEASWCDNMWYDWTELW